MRLVRILGGFNESFVAWVTQPNQDDSQQPVRGLKTEALTARIDIVLRAQHFLKARCNPCKGCILLKEHWWNTRKESKSGIRAVFFWPKVQASGWKGWTSNVHI